MQKNTTESSPQCAHPPHRRRTCPPHRLRPRELSAPSLFFISSCSSGVNSRDTEPGAAVSQRGGPGNGSRAPSDLSSQGRSNGTVSPHEIGLEGPQTCRPFNLEAIHEWSKRYSSGGLLRFLRTFHLLGRRAHLQYIPHEGPKPFPTGPCPNLSQTPRVVDAEVLAFDPKDVHSAESNGKGKRTETSDFTIHSSQLERSHLLPNIPKLFGRAAVGLSGGFFPAELATPVFLDLNFVTAPMPNVCAPQTLRGTPPIFKTLPVPSLIYASPELFCLLLSPSLPVRFLPRYSDLSAKPNPSMSRRLIHLCSRNSVDAMNYLHFPPLPSNDNFSFTFRITYSSVLLTSTCSFRDLIALAPHMKNCRYRPRTPSKSNGAEF